MIPSPPVAVPPQPTAGERRTVRVVIDGVEIRAHEGEPVLLAARRHLIDVPSLCFLEGLSAPGSCRLCMVEVAGDIRLRPGCTTPVADGMEVTTDSPRLRAARRTTVELLLTEGVHTCAVCVSDHHCELQDLAVRCGVDHVRFEGAPPWRPVDASHPAFVFDPNRCVLCIRCVRVCDEIEGAHVWQIAGRGEHARLVTDDGRPWGASRSCTSCGACVAVCPTGALSYQGTAVGEMRHDPGRVAPAESADDAARTVAPTVTRGSGS